MVVWSFRYGTVTVSMTKTGPDVMTPYVLQDVTTTCSYYALRVAGTSQRPAVMPYVLQVRHNDLQLLCPTCSRYVTTTCSYYVLRVAGTSQRPAVIMSYVLLVRHNDLQLLCPTCCGYVTTTCSCYALRVAGTSQRPGAVRREDQPGRSGTDVEHVHRQLAGHWRAGQSRGKLSQILCSLRPKALQCNYG